MATGRVGRRSMQSGETRQRCWRYDWVLDIDVRGYFDSIDWERLLRAVRHHTDCPWVLPLHRALAEGPGADGGWRHRAADGRNAARRGYKPLPRKSVPALCVRHVDGRETFPASHSSDTRTMLICHCESAEQAQALWSALQDRFAACKLVLHPEKTKIVYCKDANRKGDYPNQSFDFLGFTVPSEESVGEGRSALCVLSCPPLVRKALTSISRTVRRWALHQSKRQVPAGPGEMYNPCIRGWINYYSHFYKTAVCCPHPEEDRSLCHPLGRAASSSGCGRKTKGARDVVRTGYAEQIRCCLPTGGYCHGDGRTSGAV